MGRLSGSKSANLPCPQSYCHAEGRSTVGEVSGLDAPSFHPALSRRLIRLLSIAWRSPGTETNTLRLSGGEQGLLFLCQAVLWVSPLSNRLDRELALFFRREEPLKVESLGL